MSIITTSSSSFSKIDPIRVHMERFQYIDYIFNLCLSGSFQSATIVSPAIKVGFIERGSHVLERMFVAEDFESMLIFLRNVPLGSKPNVYIRTAHIMPRSFINYVHFTTGLIFKDLFDYCLIERDETNANLYFIHEDQVCFDLNEIIAKDQNYKTNTKIFIKTSNFEIGNSLFLYSYSFKEYIQYKVGYYLLDVNYDYFHPMINISKNYGQLQNAYNIFTSILSNSEYIVSLVNFQFQSSLTVDDEDGVKNGRKPKLIGMSLIDNVKACKSNQEKRITIGWFLCEIMYGFFFDN